MSLSDSSSHGAGGFRTFRQTSRDRKSLVLLFLLLLLLLAQQQARFHHQCREWKVEPPGKEGRKKKNPPLPASLPPVAAGRRTQGDFDNNCNSDFWACLIDAGLLQEMLHAARTGKGSPEWKVCVCVIFFPPSLLLLLPTAAFSLFVFFYYLQQMGNNWLADELHCNNRLIDYATAAAVADEIGIGIVMAAAIIIPPPPLLPLPCLMKKIMCWWWWWCKSWMTLTSKPMITATSLLWCCFPLDFLQVLIMDEVTVKVMSCTCKMADITDEGISCESSSLFFFLSVCLSLLMPSCLALLHFLRLLATIIETKPWLNKHRIEFRGKERERMCCVNLDLLCFLIVAISSSMYTFTNCSSTDSRKERERESVCVCVWFFPPPAPPFFCSGWGPQQAAAAITCPWCCLFHPAFPGKVGFLSLQNPINCVYECWTKDLFAGKK